MAGVELTARMDTSVLESVIPELVALGRRTMAEQSITSMGWILTNAQKETPHVEVGRIDSELEVLVSPKLSTRGARKGLPLKSGKKNVAVPNMSYAMMIAIARLHPGSKYSQLTGNRWTVAMPDTEGSEAFFDYMARVASRMVSSRHSSTHYLQAGYKWAIKKCFNSPLFQHSKQYRSRSVLSDSQNVNPLNRLSGDKLGETVIEVSGDECVITSMNNVGDAANAVLDAKRREALIRYSGPKLQEAIDQEAAVCEAELVKRWSEGALPINRLIAA